MNGNAKTADAQLKSEINPYESPRLAESELASGTAPVRLTRAEARQRLKWPAICLGICGVFEGFALFGVLMTIAFSQALSPHVDEERILILFVYGTLFIGSFIVVLGAREMWRVGSYSTAVGAGLIAICALVSMPFGIWALRVLVNSRVRKAFEK